MQINHDSGLSITGPALLLAAGNQRRSDPLKSERAFQNGGRADVTP
jgi:hypothetical protein